MNDWTDQQLLRDYTERRAEPAFSELVRRHIDLVYSAALRMVRDAHLAQDVTQGAFAALAQNARQLRDRPVLSGWLHRTAQNLASKAVRSDVRRRAREQEAAAMNELLSAEPDPAWDHVAPHLDDALGALSEPDRDALLLRYFERKSAREMAQVLGTSEDAAQKRVNRAVERLREFFARRGVTVGAGGLVVVISTNAVQAAPVGLAAAMSATALAATLTTAALATQTAATTTMNLINAKTLAAILASALVAGAGTYFVQEREARRLQIDKQDLLVQQATLTAERDEATNHLALLSFENDQLKSNTAELLRLRGEVGRLRQQTNELFRLQAENRQLRTQAQTAAARSPTAAPSPGAMSPIAAQNACINNLRQIDGAMQQCALEFNLSVTNTLTAEMILPYMGRPASAAQFPQCPAGGTYTFGSLTNPPTCSIPGHSLQ